MRTIRAHFISDIKEKIKFYSLEIHGFNGKDIKYIFQQICKTSHLLDIQDLKL